MIQNEFYSIIEERFFYEKYDPMDFSPTSNGCTRGLRCTADIRGLKGAATTPALSSDPITIVATPVTVCPLIIPDSSSKGAPMLIVTPRMIQAPMHAGVEPTIGLSFSLEPNFLFLLKKRIMLFLL